MIMNVNALAGDLSSFPLCILYDVPAHEMATRKGRFDEPDRENCL